MPLVIFKNNTARLPGSLQFYPQAGFYVWIISIFLQHFHIKSPDQPERFVKLLFNCCTCFEAQSFSIGIGTDNRADACIKDENPMFGNYGCIHLFIINRVAGKIPFASESMPDQEIITEVRRNM